MDINTKLHYNKTEYNYLRKRITKKPFAKSAHGHHNRSLWLCLISHNTAHDIVAEFKYL